MLPSQKYGTRRTRTPRSAAPSLFALFLLLAGTAQAAQVNGLFEVNVPVQSQQEEQRKEGLKQALRVLLVKVTGDPQVVKRGDIKESLSQAENYVQRYGWHDAKTVGAPTAGTLLQVVFDEAAVRQLLEAHGVALWGANRPAVLTWIGIHSGSEQRLLSPELDEALRNGVEYGARQAGVPVILPLGDLDDQAQLSAAKLVAPNSDEALRAASERYSPDLIFAGLLNEKPGEGWVGNWYLLGDGVNQRWQSQGANSATLAADAFAKVAETLAQQFAPAFVGGGASPDAPGAGAVELAVSGINSLADYARIKHLLFGINSAAKVRLQGTESDQLYYQMESRGPLNTLQRELTLGGMLKPEEDDVSGGPDEEGITHLHYQIAL